MTLQEAQDLILTGRSAEITGSHALDETSTSERAEVLEWLKKNVDYKILANEKPIEVEDAFYKADLTDARSGKISLIHALIMLNQMQKLIKAEPTKA